MILLMALILAMSRFNLIPIVVPATIVGDCKRFVVRLASTAGIWNPYGL